MSSYAADKRIPQKMVKFSYTNNLVTQLCYMHERWKTNDPYRARKSVLPLGPS